MHTVDGFDPDGATVTTYQPFAGEHVDRYLLGDKLAQGSFGFVFRAFDVQLDREVALKILNPDHANKREIVRRFFQEATAISRISHPGVVNVLDCGTCEGGAYIAMDLLDGESLAARLDSCGRMLPGDAIEVARQIASVLEAAHAAGVLHRDLKPDNIFVVNDPAMPDGLRIKVLDFGLAKILEEHGRSRTGIQAVMGTPRYMSPEQCRSSTSIDHRSDIYALGCILFELVTGRAPFEGDLEQMIEAHLTGTVPRASALCGCSHHLDDLIAQLMAKDPARRLQSMTAVRHALDNLPHTRMGSAPLVEPPQRTPLPRIGPISSLVTSKRLPALRPAAAGSSRVPKTTLPPPPVAPPRLPRASSASPPLPRMARASTVPPPLTLTKFTPPASAPPAHKVRPPTSAPLPHEVRPPTSASPPTTVTAPSPTTAASSSTKFTAATSATQLPPYFRPPTVVASPPSLPTPLPSTGPSMSTALAMNMAYVPTSVKAPALMQPLAVPLGLPSPTQSYDQLPIPPLDKLPIVLLAIACAMAGVVAALLLT